jgi:hypothetical protein
MATLNVGDVFPAATLGASTIGVLKASVFLGLISFH